MQAGEALYTAGVLVAVFCLTFGMGWFWSQLSGWPKLVAAYPDRPEQVSMERHRYERTRIGTLLGTGVRFWLTLEVCPTGLRIKKSQLIDFHSDAVFVPWRDIQTDKRTGFGPRPNFLGRITLIFGEPPIGSIEISGDTAASLAKASNGALTLPEEPWTDPDWRPED
jgi:hypothetical protein